MVYFCVIYTFFMKIIPSSLIPFHQLGGQLLSFLSASALRF